LRIFTVVSVINARSTGAWRSTHHWILVDHATRRRYGTPWQCCSRATVQQYRSRFCLSKWPRPPLRHVAVTSRQ